MTASTKKCSACGSTFLLEVFGRDRHSRDGLNSKCRTCVAAQARARRDADPEAENARAREWGRCNREKRSETNRRYHAANVEAISARKRRAYIINAEMHRAKARHKRHVRRQVEKNTDLTSTDVRGILASRAMCPCCGKKMTDAPGPRQKNLDHIVPINIGGTHTAANIRVICRTCNLARPKDGSDLEGFQPALWSVTS